MQENIVSEISPPIETAKTGTRNRIVEVPVCTSCGLELRKNYKAQWFCLECNIAFVDSKLLLRIAEEKAEFSVYQGLRNQQLLSSPQNYGKV